MPGSEWAPFLGKFLGLGLVLVAVHGTPDDGRDARSGDTGLSGLRDRAVPEDPVRASASRIPPLRAARPRGARAGEPEVRRSPGGDHRLRVHRPRRPCSGSSTTCSSTAPVRGGPTRRCAASARRSGRGCGSSSTGRRGRCCSRWRRGCSGCAAGRAASACGSSWRAVASRVPRRGSPAAAAALVLALGGFIFYNTNVLNAYRSASDIDGAARRVRAALRAVREYPAAPAGGDQPARRDLSRAAGGGDPRHLPPGERQRTCRSTPSTWPRRPAASRPERSPSTDRPRSRSPTRSTATGSTPSRGRSSPATRCGSTSRCTSSRVASATRRRPLGGGERQLLHESDVVPGVGYQRHRELLSAADRREHGLAPRPVIASLDDVEGARTRDRAAGASRSKRWWARTRTRSPSRRGRCAGRGRKDGRRYFHYATDAPIGSEWAFFSADYAVREATVERRRDPDLPSPAHTAHLDRMVRSVRASLDYYTRQFGPYPYRHLSVVEHPGAPGTGMHAEASMITSWAGHRPLESEGRSEEPRFPVRGRGARDGAPVDAARTHSSRELPLLCESLAWYSAMQVVRDVTRGRAASAAPALHAAAVSTPRRFAAVSRCCGRSTRTSPTARVPSRCTR